MSSNPKYELSQELDQGLRFLMVNLPDVFQKCPNFNIAVFFVKKEPISHFAGKCTKLPDAVRFKTKLDFIIEIWKEYYDKSSIDERFQLLIHELHHVDIDQKGNPKILRHNEKENFCELPTHDLYSKAIMRLLRTRLTAKDQIEEKALTA